MITGSLPREKFNCTSVETTVTAVKSNDDVMSNQGLHWTNEDL